MLVTQSCLTLCDFMDCSLPSSSVHRISQARILEWFAAPFSRAFSWPKDQTQVSCIVSRFFTIWATREAPIIYRLILHILVKVTQSCPILCNLMDCSPSAPMSIEFFRQEYWSGLLFPSPGEFLKQGSNPGSPALQVDSLPTKPPGTYIYISPTYNKAWTEYDSSK